MESPNPGIFDRVQIDHCYKRLTDEHLVFDDIYSNFNTQTSSQWDGLRHVAHYSTGKFYNGVSPAQVAKEGPEIGDRLGIHHMARRGIVGRAVLLDYARWAVKNRPGYSPFERLEVTVDELDQVAASQGVEFEHGDILLIHFGWIESFESYGESIQKVIPDRNNPRCAGVKACEETFRWMWNHHFAAVAADNFPFEAFPFAWENSCRMLSFFFFFLPLLTLSRFYVSWWLGYAYW